MPAWRCQPEGSTAACSRVRFVCAPCVTGGHRRGKDQQRGRLAIPERSHAHLEHKLALSLFCQVQHALEAAGCDDEVEDLRVRGMSPKDVLLGVETLEAAGREEQGSLVAYKFAEAMLNKRAVSCCPLGHPPARSAAQRVLLSPPAGQAEQRAHGVVTGTGLDPLPWWRWRCARYPRRDGARPTHLPRRCTPAWRRGTTWRGSSTSSRRSRCVPLACASLLNTALKWRAFLHRGTAPASLSHAPPGR